MRYELTILLPGEITVVNLERLEKLIKRYAKIINKEVDGVKHMAYPLHNRNMALYVYYNLDMPSDATSSLANRLNINDDVVRYLLVKEDRR